MSLPSDQTMMVALHHMLLVAATFLGLVVFTWLHEQAIALASKRGTKCRSCRLLEATAYALLGIDCVWLVAEAGSFAWQLASHF